MIKIADLVGYIRSFFFYEVISVPGIVLKPGPARWVDPGPGRPGPGTGPGLSKNPAGSWPGETRSTQNPAETRLPSFFVFKWLSVETEKTSSRNRREGIQKTSSPSFLMTGASRCYQNVGTKKRYTAS